MKAWVRGAGILAAVMILSSSPAWAAKGLHLGIGLGVGFPVMSGDAISDIKPETGDALELLNLGYGFTDNIYAGLYYGAVAGLASKDWDKNAFWGNGYLGILGKYSFTRNKNYSPYLELGLHNTVFDTTGDNHTFVSDAAIGVLAGGGMDFFFGARKRGMFSLDLSYRSGRHSSGTVDLKHGPNVDVNFNATTDVILLLFKIGYVWRPLSRPGL
jgi:hypothetical protein